MAQQAINGTIVELVTLEALTCHCGVAFAAEQKFLRARRDKNGGY